MRPFISDEGRIASIAFKLWGLFSSQKYCTVIISANSSFTKAIFVFRPIKRDLVIWMAITRINQMNRFKEYSLYVGMFIVLLSKLTACQHGHHSTLIAPSQQQRARIQREMSERELLHLCTWCQIQLVSSIRRGAASNHSSKPSWLHCFPRQCQCFPF